MQLARAVEQVHMGRSTMTPDCVQADMDGRMILVKERRAGILFSGSYHWRSRVNDEAGAEHIGHGVGIGLDLSGRSRAFRKTLLRRAEHGRD